MGSCVHKRYAAADDAIHLAINGVFAFLILGAFWFTNGTVDSEFLVNLLFYIIITPVISVTLTKLCI